MFLVLNRGLIMKKLILAILLIIVPLVLNSCSVGMALSGSEQRDTSVFYQGAHRSFVHAKTGLPYHSIKDKDGGWIDTYLIVKGNEPSAGRAIGHGVMDVLTLGLWEVIGTPIEAFAGREEHDRFVLYYDQEDKIERVERFHVETRQVDKDANLNQNEAFPLTQSN